MKTLLKYTFAILLVTNFLYSCKDDETDIPDDPKKTEGTVGVETILPEGSNADLSGAVVYSLGSISELNSSQTGQLPYNENSIELAYLLDDKNNVLLAGFLSDDRKEISVETTTEVMLYYALDYYLLPADARKAFLASVKQVPGFTGLVTTMNNLFKEDPLMYSKGTYLPKLTEKTNQIAAQDYSVQLKRLSISGQETKSGITVSKIDSVHIELRNSFPRRTKVFVYKKQFYDRSGKLNEVANYTNNPIADFDFEPGKKMNIETLEVGSKLSQINAQSASVDNISTSDLINLPVNKSSEFVAEYEIVVIGDGALNSIGRNLSETEKKAYEDLNVRTYALDYFLPTLLDIGGNKHLLPPFGNDQETALLNAVLPALQANTNVYDAIKNNDFKTASETLLPELYGDIRLSNELRALLTNVYKIISDNGTMPNTFVQSQELIETGYERTKKVMEAMFKNMNFGAKVNIEVLRTGAKSVESWVIYSIDAEVNLSPKVAEVCLGDAHNIKVSLRTFYDPEVEELEFHWKTSNKYGGRIQDINDNPANFGASIISKKTEVSYISAALASELGEGDNIETVTVTIYTKNIDTGQLTKVGQDIMTVNNIKTCISFFVPFSQEVEIKSFPNRLACGGKTEYRVETPIVIAQFTAVEGAKSYIGRILKKDGSYANEFPLTNLKEIGNDKLEFQMAVGPLVTFLTCKESEAIEEQQKNLNYLNEVGHQGIEITPVF
jgi:hypothetical protein